VKILGYSIQELIGFSPKEIMELVYCEDRTAYFSRMERRLRGESAESYFEFRTVRKDGAVIWAECLSNQVQFEGQLALQGIFLNIDQRKKGEEIILKSEARYRELANFLPEIVFETDLAGKITFFSRRAFEITGFTPEELEKGVNMLQFVVPQERERAKENIRKSLSGEVRNGHEYTLYKKDGVTYPAVVKTAPIISENKVLGLRGLVMDISERKKAQDLLQRSEGRFRQLSENAEEWIWEVNSSGMYTYSSSVVDKLLGFKPEELVGKKYFYDLFPADEREELKNAAFEAFDRKSSFKDFLNHNVHKNGSIVSLSTSGVPLLDEKGGLLGYRGLDVDITERKKAEEVLRESEESFRSLIDSMDDLVFVLGFDGIFKNYHQPSHKKELYVSPEEFVGKHFRDILPKNVADLFEAALSRIEVSSESQEIEYSLEIQGETLQYNAKLSPAKDAFGQTNSITVVARNITGSKKSEVTLRQERDKLESVTTAVGAGLIIVSKDFRVLYANDFIKRYKGDTVGKLCYSTLNSLDGPCPDCGVAKVFAGKTTLDVHEYCSTTIDGHPYWVEISASPIKDEKGDVISAVEIAVDITVRKNNEERLNQMMDQLLLVNEKLGVVGSLTRHDVRNKLSTVTGYTYLLKKKHADNAEIVDGLGKMEQAIQDSMKIFDFAKIYEQIGIEELICLDAEKTINEAVAFFSDLNFKVVNDCHGLTVLADSFLRQLFYNFIDNTRKYGKKTSCVRVFFEKTETGELRLIYEDDGVGISFENKLRLFKEGFSTGGSTGFGLFLIKKMLDVYGWSISEEGEPGKGVKFIILIPKINQSGKENFRIN
jgi:PAS domain S-box-containing protein